MDLPFGIKALTALPQKPETKNAIHMFTKTKYVDI
jgi:hypothetical protein